MKYVYLFLAVVVPALLVVACSGGVGESAATLPAPTEAEPAETVAAPTAAPTDEPTIEPTVAPTDEPAIEPTAAPTDEPTPEPTPTATTEPTATAAPPTDTPPPPTEEAAPPARASVSIEDFQFSPGNLTVSVGTTVVWTHVGEIRHTVTADDGSFDSPTLASGDVFEFTFNTPGTYGYYCRFHGGADHSGMAGFIIVTE